MLAADVLAWDVDFYQDVRYDRMRILVEKVYADGKLLRYGEVLAAEYDGVATGRKRLFRYTDATGQTSYFDDDGVSARRGFLKSPLKYAHITSSFGRRRHPVLGYTRAHEGVDYGAPTGTPIWAVGEGAVRQAGWKGGCGKAVVLKHRNGLETITATSRGSRSRPASRCRRSRSSATSARPASPPGRTSTSPSRAAERYVNPLQLKVPRDSRLSASACPISARRRRRSARSSRGRWR